LDVFKNVFLDEQHIFSSIGFDVAGTGQKFHFNCPAYSYLILKLIFCYSP